MNRPELEERVYEIIRARIRPRISERAVAAQSGTLQAAVNTALVNITVLATNRSIETAIDHLFTTQRKILGGVTRENASANAFWCLEHFRTEIRSLREMHKMLDAGAENEAALQRFENLIATNAAELDAEFLEGPDDPSEMSQLADEPEDEPSFIKRMTEARRAKRE